MLITFSCQAYPKVTLFGDVGKQLLKLMGCQATPSGAIPADSVHARLESLQKAVAMEKETSTENSSKNNPDTDFNDENISMAKRALPLIEMLKAAEQEKCNIWWECK